MGHTVALHCSPIVVSLQRSSRLKTLCTSCRRSTRSCRRQPKSKSPSRLTTTRWSAVACMSTTPAMDRCPCVSDHANQELWIRPFYNRLIFLLLWWNWIITNGCNTSCFKPANPAWKICCFDTISTLISCLLVHKVSDLFHLTQTTDLVSSKN